MSRWNDAVGWHIQLEMGRMLVTGCDAMLAQRLAQLAQQGERRQLEREIETDCASSHPTPEHDGSSPELQTTPHDLAR